VLDCIGDLYLAGGPLIGHFRGVRSGHKFNHLLLKALLADREAWTFVTLPAPEALRVERPLTRALGLGSAAVPA
jgi:UDP-3-O-acyl-N-acetylglucosamine deacetylase